MKPKTHSTRSCLDVVNESIKDYNDAKRSSMLPKKTTGLGSRILSSEPKFLCSSSRSMIEGWRKIRLLMDEAADADEVLEA